MDHWKGKQVTDLPQLLPNIAFFGMSIVVFVVFILWWVGGCPARAGTHNIQASKALFVVVNLLCRYLRICR